MDNVPKRSDTPHTAQKMKFSIKDFFSKCDKIRSFLQIWSQLLKKSLMENFIFVQCQISCSIYSKINKVCLIILGRHALNG